MKALVRILLLRLVHRTFISSFIECIDRKDNIEEPEFIYPKGLLHPNP